ncbi:hypothetical protein JCGZ_20870 [Jatropha curcas]|uniref:Phytocyanin domain-containing protein n=2 Tax=Jatropha curcas TaxID=180498 RepID=A0A067LH13_JATCU|nr:hypothetical protein JCGZ_20870 [Jatropha curcas]
MAWNLTVGAPNGGWNSKTQLQAWANSKFILVGDNLIFVYEPSEDNVLQVSKEDFYACESKNPIQAHNKSPTAINLPTLGLIYFISGKPGRCNQGVKVWINVLKPPLL